MSENKINVQEFVEKYQNAQSEIEKNKVLKSINIKTYVPFSVKTIHSKLVLIENIKYKDNMILSDYPMRYLMFVCSVVNLYTDLCINKERPHEDYDLLRSTGIIDDIFKNIGNDVEEFTTIFNMTYDDIIRNEAGIERLIARQTTAFIERCGNNLDALMALLDNEEVMNNIEKITNVIGKIYKPKS